MKPSATENGHVRRNDSEGLRRDEFGGWFDVAILIAALTALACVISAAWPG